MFRKFASVVLMITLCIAFLAACSSQTNDKNTSTSETDQKNVEKQETIVLRGLTAWEENNINSVAFNMFKTKVEEKSNGNVIIEYVGGPESVPANNQGEAVRSGTVDFSILTTAYITSAFPEADVLNFSELTPTEERESGALDYLNTFAAKQLNSIILGRAIDMQYSLYFKDPVKSMEDIAKKQIRAAPTYTPFLESMGAQVVSMPAGEMYTALERGVVDGVAWTEAGITDFSLEKLLAVKIKPSYNKVGIINVMNLDTYNKLPDDVKALLTEVSIEIENEVGAVVKEFLAKEEAKLTEAGVEIVTLKESEQYLKQASESSWAWLEDIIKDEKLREMYRK